jgi:hypothetical protein
MGNGVSSNPSLLAQRLAREGRLRVYTNEQTTNPGDLFQTLLK